MAVYAIFNYDVADGEGYGAYRKAAAPTMAGRPLKVLAADAATTTLEGEPGHQTVIIEFADEAAFRAWYDSPDYQAVIGLRLGATAQGRAMLVHGLGG